MSRNMIVVWAVVVFLVVGGIFVLIAVTTGDKTNDQEGVLGRPSQLVAPLAPGGVGGSPGA